MKTRVTERFTFEAAHRIDGIGKENATIHGHSHEVFVTINGEPDPRYGWLMEQGEFQKKCKHIIGYLDHSYLNEFMEQTTAEAIARHIFLRLSENRFPDHITLESVRVCKVGMCAEVSND
jgi:6-pyruvoyltetrahydropterin/6-carboxytetrahydropterin synthase